jgi:hypothetical protein
VLFDTQDDVLEVAFQEELHHSEGQVSMSRNLPPQYPPDWLDREVIPDVYKRRSDPYRPMEMLIPPVGTPSAEGVDMGQIQDIFRGFMTTPGVRPFTYQRALNISIAATDSPTPIQNATFPVDAIIVNVPSSSANSAFFGWGSNISSTNGAIEVRPGIPQFFAPDNVREQWELQRNLEMISAMLAALIMLQSGGQVQPPGPFMSPRVTFDASDYFIVNATGISQSVSVMMFYVPEFQ